MIQRVFGIALILSTCFVSNTYADEPTKKNRFDPNLEGVWILKSMERGGIKVEGEDIPARMRGTKRTIKGDQMIVARGGDNRRYECTITVDTSTKPKQLDVSAERKGEVRVLKCIYEIEDGILRIAEGDTQRPETFTTDKSATRTLVSIYTKETK